MSATPAMPALGTSTSTLASQSLRRRASGAAVIRSIPILSLSASERAVMHGHGRTAGDKAPVNLGVKAIGPDTTAYPILYRRAPLFLCRGTPNNTRPQQSPADRNLCLDDCRAV